MMTVSVSTDDGHFQKGFAFRTLPSCIFIFYNLKGRIRYMISCCRCPLSLSAFYKYFYMKHILLFLLGVIGCSQVYPQAGTLDPSFGQSGVVFTDFGATVNINGNVCKRILLSGDGSFFLV